MPRYTSRFLVRASPEAVSFFHRDPAALKRLTPPLIRVQLHTVEPIAEGSQSAFTLWFGPLPVRWLAVHTQVDPLHGFTDTQARGPLQRWVHTHAWRAVDAQTTQVVEQVEYEHFPGLPGLWTRLLFALPLVKLLFAFRQWRIRRALEAPGKRAAWRRRIPW